MGSGCISSSSSKDNCPEKISDKCVVYTGPAIPSLGICQNDRLEEVEAVILNKLQELAEGEGIVLSDITPNCPFVTQSLVNKDKNLFNLLQTLFDNQCSLRELIQEVQDNIDKPFPFSLKCLVTPTNPSKDQITQSLIDLTCALKTTVDAITDQLENPDNSSLISTINTLIGNFVGTNLSSCPNSSIKKTGQGADTKLQFLGFIPIGGVIEYDGPLTNFDQTGKGLASACLENWALCNGLNGTKDRRGWTIAMANNIQGPSLLPAVDPFSVPGLLNLDISTYVGNRKGSYTVVLDNINQIPNHVHAINDPGHSHTATENRIVGGSGNAFPLEGLKQGSGAYVSNITESTSTNTTGVTIGGIQGKTFAQEHENRPPTYYSIFIQRIS